MYIVTEPCISVKDHACVDACPVDCFYEGEEHLLIHPGECIDCGACEPECPVDAIYEVSRVPTPWQNYIDKNAAAFAAQRPLLKAPPREKWEAQRSADGTPANLYFRRYNKA